MDLTQPRLPISAFVIAYNEEKHIADCLLSLKFCDEIIVVDSFSTDRTVEIARGLGAQIIQRAWTGYKDQKAFGLSATNNEWVLNLDADERVSPELSRQIQRVLAEEYKKSGSSSIHNSNEIVGYEISRVVFYLGRWWRRGGWYPEFRLRFFRKSSVTWGGTDPHEKPIPRGKVVILPGEIEHYTYENMDDQFLRLHTFSSLAAKEEYLAGGRVTLTRLVFNPILRTFKFYFLKKGYREGVAGLIVAVAEGFYTFMKYAKLWEYEFSESLKKSVNKNDENTR